MPLPCILFEDADLVAVHKPAGIATHRAGEDSPWGISEYLVSHRPELGPLGIHQRLDRETSGVLLFARSGDANQSLARQFEKREVRKSYLFVTNTTSQQKTFTASDPIEGKQALTYFQFLRKLPHGTSLWEAHPETGRTHQVRLHAAAHDLPITGDLKSPGLPTEPLLLHASKLELRHPRSHQPMVLEAPMPDWFDLKTPDERRVRCSLALRKSLLDETETNAWRWIHRESDGFPGITVDRLGVFLYVEDFHDRPDISADLLSQLKPHARGIILSHAAKAARRETKRIVHGEPPPSDFSILENGIRFHLDPLGPGGTGIFLDQRENRRHARFLSKGKRVLNLFAYTCGFSVAAAAGGASHTMSVDLSRRAIEWGRRNFEINAMDPSSHAFVTGDAMETLRRCAARKEYFDVVIADPPSFSRGKAGGHFSAQKDFGKLAASAAKVVSPDGWMLCSTNLANWKPASFLSNIEDGIRHAKRTIIEKTWVPQPFDFPVTHPCPAHLKSIWLRLE